MRFVRERPEAVPRHFGGAANVQAERRESRPEGASGLAADWPPACPSLTESLHFRRAGWYGLCLARMAAQRTDFT